MQDFHQNSRDLVILLPVERLQIPNSVTTTGTGPGPEKNFSSSSRVTNFCLDPGCLFRAPAFFLRGLGSLEPSSSSPSFPPFHSWLQEMDRHYLFVFQHCLIVVVPVRILGRGNSRDAGIGIKLTHEGVVLRLQALDMFCQNPNLFPQGLVFRLQCLYLSGQLQGDGHDRV